MTLDYYLAAPNDAAETDDRLSLAEACDYLPRRNGKTPHLYTVRRWVAKGVSGTRGGVVRLRAFRVGGTWFTRLVWVREFIAALTDGMDGTDDGESTVTVLRRPSRELMEARRRLAARGLRRAEKKNSLPRL